MSQATAGRDSSERRLRGRPFDRLAVWWDPRRSLGARLALVFLPLVLVPALFYWYSSSLLWRRTQAELVSSLSKAEATRERTALRQAADRRLGELEREVDEVLSVGREAAAITMKRLGEGPGRGSAEELVDVPGGPIRTAERGGSAAMITRAVGVTPATLRDLSATRRLEPDLGALIVGHPAISAVFVFTSSGVLRAVPWCDLSRLVEAGGMAADFRVPSRRFGMEGTAPTWTAVYDDLYAHRGRILSVLFPVRDEAGKLVAEVGVDWVFGELFARLPEVRRHGEFELVFTRDGRLLFQFPDGAADPVLAARLFQQLGDATPDRQLSFAGDEMLASVRQIPATGWTYIRLLPYSVVRESVEAQLAPVFGATRVSRQWLQAVTVLLLILVGAPLVAATRRATAPVRGLAAWADGITRGEPAGPAPGTERQDEVGRLARAIEDLERRIRRRIRSMEGMHDLARTGAMMTRPDETFARLSRRIAELVGATKAWFALWDADSRELVFTPPGYGVDDEKLAAIRIGSDTHSLTLLAFRTGETYLTNDVAGDPRVSHSLAASVGIERNAVMVPLRTEAGSLGVLLVADKPAPFEPEDQAAIQIYADEAALLLRNARLYEELQRSYERLRDAHRNRDYFLQNINHELRTPLTAILGWSEVLAEDQPDQPTIATAVEQVRRSAQFLLTLISDLLDLSRFEEGRTQLERASTDVGALVREAIEPVAVMAEAKGIAISVAAPAPGTTTARVDPLRLRQVLWNLVHNAVKFTRKGGRIDVTAARDDKGVSFTVADDGVGIDPKDLPFIFERFRQGDGSTTRAYRGTGIGLALAKAYVELHGGRIEAENRPVAGAMFRVFVPDPVNESSGALPRPKFRL